MDKKHEVISPIQVPKGMTNLPTSSEDLDTLLKVIANLEKVKFYKQTRGKGLSVRFGAKVEDNGVAPNSEGYVFQDKERKRILIYFDLKEVLKALRSGELKVEHSADDTRYLLTYFSINDNVKDFSAHEVVSTIRELRGGGFGA